MADSIDLFDVAGDNNTEKFIDGRLKAIFFASDDSFYKVLLVEITNTNLDWDEAEIVVTGSFGDVIEETAYHFVGKLIDHPRYGKQFQATNYSTVMKTTRRGVVNFLSGDKFPGVGERTAEKIVDVLGTDALEKIDNDHSVLDQVGLTDKQKQSITDNLVIKDDLEKVIIGLNSYGFSNQLSSVIYQKYRDDALNIIAENPYRLVEDIPSIGFKRADAIAIDQGIAPDAAVRISAALLYSIQTLCARNGDTYTTTQPLLQETERMLGARGEDVPANKIAQGLVELSKESKIIGEKDRIFLTGLYNAEVQIAEHLNRLIKNNEDEEVDDEQLDKVIRKVERKFDIEYDDSQEAAIKQAIKSPLFVLTGGPGTGKTTIINGIVNVFSELNDFSLDINAYKDKPFPILLAAPTGRAAKHMTENTGLPASTIHRLLGLTQNDSEDAAITKDIDGSLVIIDEMSMVDTYLFKMLVAALPSHIKVVLVGDADQLPSVGPGQVFHDLIESKSLPVMKLNRIYRQDADSTIISLAHQIHSGRLPEDFTVNKPDRSFIPCSPAQVSSVVDQVVKRAKTKDFPRMDVQVLAPMYRGPAGIDNLNDSIQTVWQDTPGKKKVEIRNHSYMIGDKVLQLINNAEKNVFNGDIGQIVSMKQEKGQDAPTSITVDFEDTEVTYEKSEWNQFTLAYCTSIHKAQGSEFDMVILPIVHQFSRMLQRNLLYTAVTRASKFLILVGEQSAFEQCVETVSVNRQTSLIEKVKRAVGIDDGTEENVQIESDDTEIINEHTEEPNSESLNDDKVLTVAKILGNEIDPMIGMEDVTPGDFMN
ncbi:ATP-dependent RecD-like DNA helicase [Lentilactobacillus sp. Marseille-Q4993]|uniref:SF1B family DNA helicase RecD2 n=1 Tax=Lentilactobacillus sp. Marseille-Q4993 TaxID=3039492 RepID=UPI0024BD4789|nr:ATP-dependent RecD-like DNA helicase [Lentilactobacillus sp. Marseille-Q4993]